jgi:hypothetical protein
MGELRNAHKILVGESEGDHLKNLDVDGRIILEWILEKYDGKLWTGFFWLRIGTIGRLV